MGKSSPKDQENPQLSIATLRAIVEGTATARGEHFFQSLVQYLALSLDVKTTFVGIFNTSKTVVNTLAVWSASAHQPNFEYGVDETPCKGILGGSIQHFEDDIQELFPNNELLKQLDARSYLAIPLIQGDSRVVGHLGVIHDKPIKADERELSIFHIFAARATAEIIRRESDKALETSREQEKRLRDEQLKIEAEVAYLRDELRSSAVYSDLVGDSDAIWKVLRNIDVVSTTDSTVLILGETGTGKEVVARAIHKNSNRSKASFVRVNCAALPESLLESELFGHEHGAFTGATEKRTGRFELADGGTIFLDEIGEMPLAAQSRLLRVLQECELERVGGTETIQIDTRVIAATNRNLQEMVDSGDFREDLFYRLNVFPISNPPLREHKEDIDVLVHCFLKKLSKRLGKDISTVPKSVLEAMHAYDWPGNVRELENIVERAMILTNGQELELPIGVIPELKGKDRESSPLRSMVDVEVAHIRSVLEHANGVIAGPNGAAQILDMNPNTLRSRMEKLGISTGEK